MTLDHIRANRRVVRIALAAGLVAALSATGPATFAAADTAGTADPAAAPAKAVADNDKLGSVDAELLAQAKADGDKNVTLMIATTPGSTEQVADQLDAVKGASVGKTYDKLGYVRVTVPTGKADSAISTATKLSTVKAIDLKSEIQLDDPAPSSDTTRKAAKVAEAETSATTAYSGPSASTPAKNPYQPSFETGAVDFVAANPKADGRGITIGILDSGVDLAHPALQKTTTGERKIVDWVTATDPVNDGDATWRRMTFSASGPSFTISSTGETFTAPSGSYKFNYFSEAATTGGDMAGDLNRDGDKTDVWGVLYDPTAGTVRVDLDDDLDFGDEEAMKPYKDGFQIGYFGTDDPETEIAEAIPFVAEIRKDVVYNSTGSKADYVNIGVVESAHGTHVAGITAANGLFGGKVNGAAPGAKIVSSRACTWTGGCTNVALTEGMIDLVVNRGVDIVNMSIGGLPALNDGNNARAQLYTQLIDTYGVQLVISAGNSGPGANTIGDPGLADKVISVGASVSKATWAANYGSSVEKSYALFPFSSRGPREDGGFTPVISAPGASINTIPTWQAGSPVAEAGYSLPPGYGMFQGTSMASPQATGAAALLLSAAKQKGIDLTPAKLRTALTSTATHIKGAQTYEEGSGLINIVNAWSLIKKGVTAHQYTVKAPVDTAIDQYLATAGYGTGLYDREGGLKAGQRRSYEITITRTTGPAGSVRHELEWENNDGTFRFDGPSTVSLPLNTPVTVKVAAKTYAAGLHSATLKVNDPATPGTDHQILTTVVVAKAQAAPSYAVKASGSVQRNSVKSYFVTVPEGAKTLEVALGGLATGSQTRFIAITPYGVPADTTSTTFCYPNYTTTNGCRPDLRSYTDPIPGVWEIEVESRRSSPLLDNSYELTATALGVTFDPETQTVEEATVGTASPVSWTVANGFAPINGGSLKGGALGSAATSRSTIADGATVTTEVVVPEGASRLDVAIGNTSDTSADLDLYVTLNGADVGSDADGDSEESVSITNPAAGTYTIAVEGYSVPAGTTEYDYQDVFFSAALGSVNVDDSQAITLASGASTGISAEVLVSAAAPEGRQFFGELSLLNANGTAAGTGSVLISKVIG